MQVETVALLFQALPPPTIDGLRKAPKPGGYSDSGADIAVALRHRGHIVATPVSRPDPGRALDWVFPDTPEGLADALAAGASVVWANTVVFAGHPVEHLPVGVRMVGQAPADVQRFDQKFETNRLLAAHGLPVAGSITVSTGGEGAGTLARSALDEAALAHAGLVFPLIVKPVRGRGSQGVSRVETMGALTGALDALFADGAFGASAMVEAYLPGEELTITVLPPSARRPDGSHGDGHWALRPVRRFDQRGGVAPYNGDVPVVANSAALSAEEAAAPAIQAAGLACGRAAAAVGARALIRIDCRADANGVFQLFDLNMKPNMTGPGRPGREDQACLSAIAAEAEGWSYPDLLEAMLQTAWAADGA